MPAPGPCPPRARLLGPVSGLLPAADSAGLEDHVLTCAACVHALRDDPVVSALRAQRAAPEAEVGTIGRLLGAAGEPAEEVYDFLAPPAEPGEIGRLGPYRVRRVLGVGGMGVVFEADDPALGRAVALKVPRPSPGRGPPRRRFAAEARACAALAHENVLPILHVGDERGVPFLVLPRLRGETLEDRLRRDGRLPPADVLRIGGEIAAGLDVATGRAVVLDFGLARELEGAGGGTHSGTVVGTPAYMAPEQARGDRPDARSDLFGLGCVLDRAATGVSPFHRPHVLAPSAPWSWTTRRRPARSTDPFPPPGSPS